jgi:hypothetical protein
MNSPGILEVNGKKRMTIKLSLWIGIPVISIIFKKSMDTILVFIPLIPLILSGNRCQVKGGRLQGRRLKPDAATGGEQTIGLRTEFRLFGPKELCDAE